MKRTTVTMIKKELELYIQSAKESLKELEEDGIFSDYTRGYLYALEKMLNKINGKETMFSRDY